MSIGVKSLQGPLKDEVANIYNLCPISCGVGQKQTNLSGWLRMDIKPEEESVKVAMLTLAARSNSSFGWFSMLSKDIIEPVMHSGEALHQFHSNLSRLTDHFICILRHGIFPGAPWASHVIWALMHRLKQWSWPKELAKEPLRCRPKSFGRLPVDVSGSITLHERPW